MRQLICLYDFEQEVKETREVMRARHASDEEWVAFERQVQQEIETLLHPALSIHMAKSTH